ncbi:Ribbon-helix-helix domain protein [Planococcus massiliensis]|uniref:Ribbon-helix-helix domain protein n=1 Tax=Planococcus massiliensis TaxID=1499687 RepID=A0A098EMU4_9BACL|nr:ribbon-helix-helix domain-containing protein [Planococcus massiliensis]CEG23140.1 Ribbon-helix-helix domain protein [Planococcus massiliensis]
MKIKVTYSLDEKLIEKLKEVSEKTMIPQSRIVEAAIKEKLEEMESTKK